MAIDFNQSPVYDDFDEAKGFLRILFRPGYAVQARELTQLQTILQNQISRMGAFTFKSGSQVLGGQLTFDTNVTTLNVAAAYANTNLTPFTNAVLTDSANTIRAQCLSAFSQSTGSNDPSSLFIKYLTGVTFANGATVQVEGLPTANLKLDAAANYTSNAAVVSLSEGVFFIDLKNINPTSNANANNTSITTNAFFVRVPSQTIVISKFNNAPTCRIGLQISDAIIDETSDGSLFDPALESSNFQAPGATRYIINATLSYRTLDSTDDSNFVELMRVNNGIIQSKQTYPQLSELNKTLARRTYDQSGSFTVTPFTIHLLDDANTKVANANSSNYYVSLDPGKAYVQGYEYELIAAKTLSAPKARTTANAGSQQILTYFGNYVKISNVKGEIDFPSLVTLDLHCVSSENVVTSNTSIYANTKLGTAKIRALEYDSSVNTGNNLALVYRAYLFDVNTAAIAGTTVAATSNTIQFGSSFSAVANAYYDMWINIPSTGDTRYITSYNGTTQTATVNSPWSSTPGAGTGFNIFCDVAQTESLGGAGATGYALANANINIASKIQARPYHTTFLTDNNFQSLVFKFPYGPMQVGSVAGQNFRYRAKIGTVTLPPNSPTAVALSLTDSTATLTSPGISGSDAVALNDFLLVANTGGGATILPMVASKSRSVAVAADGKSATFTTSASDPTFTNVDIYASVFSQAGVKLKTLVSANTVAPGVAGTGTFVPAANANVFMSLGQVVFANTAQTSLKTAGVPQSLFIADANNIVAIVDSGAPGTAVTAAMIQSAVASTSSIYNITNRYTFNNGQKDSYYDHASISLIPGSTPPAGQVAVLVNYYSHSSTGGYFIADSYPDYSNIPTYTVAFSGENIDLRNALDFRPRRTDATSSFTFNSGVAPITPQPLVTSGFTVSGYSYYLPRVDKVFLGVDGIFQIVQGQPSSNPIPPSIPDGAMLLYTLAIPPYTFNTKNIKVKATDNRRYTMADIGTLDKRIRALEYYATLSALEKAATSQSIVDNNGLERPKNGILTDPFKGTSVGDVKNLDYYCAIDPEAQELRPAFTINEVQLTLDSANSTNYSQSSKIFTLNFTSENFIDQPLASRIENINPYNVVVWNGQMQLDPESDTWVDTNQLPDVITNLSGDFDAWAAIGQALSTDPRSPFAAQWNNWQTVWSGTNVIDQTTTVGPAYINGTSMAFGTQWHPWGVYTQAQDVVTSTTYSVTDVNVRTGVQNVLSSDVIQKSLGQRVVNTNIIPYIRSRAVYFAAQAMRPLTIVYPYFDSVNVANYVCRANEIIFDRAININDTYGVEEVIFCGINTAKVLYSTLENGNTKAYVTDIVGSVANNQVWSCANGTMIVTNYRQYSGNVGSSYNQANTFKLQPGWHPVNGVHNGQGIFIVSGKGAGQSGVITSYNSVTGNVAVTGITETLDNTSQYSIGSLKTDDSGVVCGKFIIPSTSGLRFRTGERLFRLIDDPNNNASAATTKAEDKYSAQGTLQTVQNDIVSTRVPTIRTVGVSQVETVTSQFSTTTASTEFAGYYDPLAQNILVDATIYPDGIFVSSVKMVFRSKDNKIPVTMQIRPVVNGFPHSTQIIPLAECTLRPDQVNVANDPTDALDDATKLTEFVFDAPIYLAPGTEYALVIVSNSNNYEVYTALMGEKMIGSDRMISSPPYLGAMFKSQNASTWTPFQGENWMFRVMKAVFNTAGGYVTFKKVGYDATLLNNIVPSANVYADTVYVGTADKIIKNTRLNYSYRAKSNVSGVLDTTYSYMNVNDNFDFASRKLFDTSDNCFYLQAALATNNKDVSPIIDLERMSVLCIANQINNTNAGEGGATRGGSAITRYITRRVTLANGMDAGDLNVFFEAHKPIGSQVSVYYKILSAEDNDSFENKNWTQMVLNGTDTFAKSDNDFTEYEYVGALDSSGEPIRQIGYSTFTTFKTFAVKIVLTSSDPCNVPRVKNFRAVAMPGTV